MTYWKQLSRKPIYTSGWLTVTVDKLELPDGKIIDNFELMHFPHKAVGIVAVNEKNEILLVRAYRYLRESFNWEIPGGVVEPEENLLEACRRELEEETGYTAGMITPIISFYPHKATCDQIFHIYLGENLSKTEHDFQRDEITEIGFHSLEAIHKMIDTEEIDDGMTIVAMLRYMLRVTDHTKK
jgi:ADP-ribose pyrophosphatase